MRVTHFDEVESAHNPDYRCDICGKLVNFPEEIDGLDVCEECNARDDK